MAKEKTGPFQPHQTARNIGPFLIYFVPSVRFSGVLRPSVALSRPDPPRKKEALEKEGVLYEHLSKRVHSQNEESRRVLSSFDDLRFPESLGFRKIENIYLFIRIHSIVLCC